MSGTSSDLYLSPKQQDLLMAALTSNQSPPSKGSTGKRNSVPFTPAGLSDSAAPDSGHLDFSDDSPYLDFGLEEGDELDFSPEGKMFDDLPDDGTEPHSDLHDKRKSIDGKDDDDEGGGKRREGEDKTAKKPGRKPLTSEPTSKRKAQNRAAQRAFRERKEKHLKDLETKVEDLEKVSAATNHENGMLKAQVERLQVELKEYRKRLSWISSNGIGRQQSVSSQQKPSSLAGNNDFQFQFPKFGDLPATSLFGAPNEKQTSQQHQTQGAQRNSSVPAPSTASPVSAPSGRHSVSSAAPYGQQRKSNSMSASPMNNNYSASPSSYSAQEQQNNIDSLTGLFSPSILEATTNSPNGYFQGKNQPQGNMSGRGSFDNGYPSVAGVYSNSSISNTESPGSSSESHHQSSSSIGTSPDPAFNSPNNKLQDFTLNTINEEAGFGNNSTETWNVNTSNLSTDIDPSGFNWLAQQNGGSFDPVLFGDYRETQDNVLSQDFGSFFNDAYPLPELGSPSHNYGEVNPGAVDQAPKDDLMARVDAAKDSEGTKPDVPKMMTCNKIWDRLQSMEKFRNGEIDIDNLCSELRAKAKCSEGGAVVDEKHVNKILGL